LFIDFQLGPEFKQVFCRLLVLTMADSVIVTTYFKLTVLNTFLNTFLKTQILKQKACMSSSVSHFILNMF